MSPNPRRDRAPLTTWWTVWAVGLAGLVILQLVLGRAPLPPNLAPEKSLTGLVGLVPLFVSIILRWLVLPRYEDLRRAFVGFILGLVLAEACGVLGLVLGGPYRDDLFLLGVLGVAQFVPFFAKQFRDPRHRDFRPNN